MWIKNFFMELKAWFIVNRVYRAHKRDFLDMHLKSDWFGRIYTVINRNPEIELGSDEDKAYLHKETAAIWGFLMALGIADILAYELSPLESETEIGDGQIEYEHGYFILFTPAWSLDRQYVTWKSILALLCVIGVLIYLGCNFIVW